MKTNTMKKLAFAAFGLAVTSATSMAADYTWQGNGGDWSAGSNWQGDAAPTGAGHTLLFAGADQTSNNNDQLTSVSGITFDAEAGEFILTGTALTLDGNITNNSTKEQTINLGLALNGHRIFNTQEKAGNTVISGAISGASRGLVKNGLGTLTLSGNNTYTGRTWIYGGTLVLDASGAGSITSSHLRFGEGDGIGATLLPNTSTFVLQGGNSTINNLEIRNSAANTIKVGTGANLTFTAYNRGTAANQTLHFDVSAAGSSISFTTAPTLSVGKIERATVKDTTGKTSFATLGTGNTIVALTGTTHLSPTLPGGNDQLNVFINSDINYTTLWATNNTGTYNSLTIQNAGTSEGSISGGRLDLRDILMQEDTGNFTIKNTQLSGVNPLAIHQYSTSGILTIDAPIFNDNAAAVFTKTGPGTVVISESSSSTYTGATYLQGGRLELNGALLRTGSMTVFDGATLAGGGTLGSEANNTATTIRAGGTLGGTSSSALDITGTLMLESDSVFVSTLGSGGDYVNVSGDITLQDNVTLNLTGTPADFNTRINLLASGTSISGSFYYNNAALNDGDIFSSGGYNFQYFQDTKNIWVEAIPEPSVALLVGLSMAFMLIRRRR